MGACIYGSVLCVCVSEGSCLRVLIHVRGFVCACTCACVCAGVCVHVRWWERMRVYVYACVNVCICENMNVCVYVCVCGRCMCR